MLENVWQSPGTRREAKQIAIKKMENGNSVKLERVDSAVEE
jgi:hypothetical protein